STFLQISCFFTVTATAEIYTLSLHDALPISTVSRSREEAGQGAGRGRGRPPHVWVAAHSFAQSLQSVEERLCLPDFLFPKRRSRSEEHTSELQSLRHLVCRLLLEKKKNTY